MPVSKRHNESMIMAKPAPKLPVEQAPPVDRFPSMPAAGDTGAADQREQPRSHAQDLSEIILDSRRHGHACMIRDISELGARLETSCGELPKRFILANYTRRTKTLCRLVWRDGQHLGVHFLTTPRAFRIDEGL